VRKGISILSVFRNNLMNLFLRLRAFSRTSRVPKVERIGTDTDRRLKLQGMQNSTFVYRDYHHGGIFIALLSGVAWNSGDMCGNQEA
jgi:hypothetical protein